VARDTTTAPAAVDANQHGLRAHSHDPGVVPVQTRSERVKSTDPADFPGVTGREVDWKYTPVDRIRMLTEGDLDGSPYAVLYPEVAETQVEWIDAADTRVGVAGIPEDKASANAWSSVEKVLRVAITGEAPSALTLTRTNMGTVPRAAHLLVEVQANARALVVIENRGAALLAENIEIIVGQDAQLTLVSLQEWDDQAVHLSSQFARLDRGGRLKHIVVSLGGAIVRVNPQAALAGEGAVCELLGIYFAEAGQHLEQQVFVHHIAPHTVSRVTYKGALNGVGARTVWIGDVLIGRDATGTDSYEQNRNLVLSDGTRADSIPNLEIETGDIVGAGHASATGRFDDEHLFYLQSRGITEKEARRLVVLGFLAEIVQAIGEPALEERLIAALEAEMEAAS